jgi:hypothetical protein
MSLANLERVNITGEWIAWYREEHKSRARETHLSGGLIKPRHKHWNNPYCSICDIDIEEGDECFILYVGGHALAYHSECVMEFQSSKKVQNIIAQDRAHRERIRVDPKRIQDAGSLIRE